MPPQNNLPSWNQITQSPKWAELSVEEQQTVLTDWSAQTADSFDLKTIDRESLLAFKIQTEA